MEYLYSLASESGNTDFLTKGKKAAWVQDIMIGCDDVLHYHWLFEILDELGREMADLIMNVSAMKVFKYLCIYLYMWHNN